MISKTEAFYFFLVVIIAAMLASGWAGMTHESVPLQVQKDSRLPVVTFTPAPAPAPAIQTHVPQYVPGSYADTHRNSTDNGDFSPAPAPVVVTTAPLPTITPTGTTIVSQPVSQPRMCCNDWAWNTSAVLIEETMGPAMNLMIIMPFMMGIGFILMTLIRIMGPSDSECGGGELITGVIMFIIIATILAIMPAVLSSVVAATPQIGCAPC